MDDDFYFIAVSGQRFIDRVVEDFEHHVVQSSAIARIADVHTGPLAYGLQAFEYFYAVGIIFRGRHLYIIDDGQMRIGITTYLKSLLPGIEINMLLLASPTAQSISPVSRLFRTSSR